MRGGVAIAIVVVALASFWAAAGSAATSATLQTQVELRVKSLATRTIPARSSRRGTRRTKSATAVLEEAVVARINLVRRGHGLRPLRSNRRLAAAAAYHSGDMAHKGYFEHDSANGTAFWRRIERFYPSRGFRSWTVGENLLWASDTYGAAFAVREWMHSPPHRANILSRDWREVGIGAVIAPSAPGAYGGRAVTIVTADFGART
ncbi:MAG TPA: CAP domain-containing protein [Gaiellaceae bacterium]|nr:CAP domain-containing protein [Gaiellaceae bacterium]